MHGACYVGVCVAIGWVSVTIVHGAEDKAAGKETRILLLGDSILQSMSGRGAVEPAMARQFEKMNLKGFKVHNMARGGMWIGPGDTSVDGISAPLLAAAGDDWYTAVKGRVPDVDVIIVEFGANDSKVYPPDVFGQKLTGLCDRLGKDYPKARLILSTGMWQDPKHSGGYYRKPSMVKGFKQGANRNEYLAPYYEQIREVARKRGCPLADLCERFKAEAEAGNWDVRQRDKPDSETTDNIHPNERGNEVIADCYIQAVLKTGRELVPFGKATEPPTPAPRDPASTDPRKEQKP